MTTRKTQRVLRQARRVSGMATDPNLHPVLGAIAPVIVKNAEDLLAASNSVNDMASTVNKETDEASSAVEKLAREYDILRCSIRIAAPHEPTGGAASSYNTPDDLLKASEDCLAILEKHKDEGWAETSLAHFGPVLDEATREWNEGVGSRNSAQKLKYEFWAFAERFSSNLVEFRDMVRKIYGPSSREYHQLRTYYGRDGGGDPDQPETDANTDA